MVETFWFTECEIGVSIWQSGNITVTNWFNSNLPKYWCTNLKTPTKSVVVEENNVSVHGFNKFYSRIEQVVRLRSQEQSVTKFSFQPFTAKKRKKKEELQRIQRNNKLLGSQILWRVVKLKHKFTVINFTVKLPTASQQLYFWFGFDIYSTSAQSEELTQLRAQLLRTLRSEGRNYRVKRLHYLHPSGVTEICGMLYLESCEFSNRDVSQLTSLTSPDIPISIKLHTEIEKNSIHPFDSLHYGVMTTCGGSRIYQMALAPEKSAPTYYFCPKLRENERIWTERGACIPGAPHGSATDYSKNFYFWMKRNGFQNTRRTIRIMWTI